MQCKCRNELKMITHERGVPRDADSSTRLMDFAKVHPETFDLLWCTFAYTLSATRILEAAHGFQRESWDSQRSFRRNDAQLRYMMLTVFRCRHARRKVLLDRTNKNEEEDKKERKSAVKHCDRKYTAVMISEQSIQLSLHYMKSAIEDRISPDVIKANQIVAIKKQGMKTI